MIKQRTFTIFHGTTLSYHKTASFKFILIFGSDEKEYGITLIFSNLYAD